jgi:glycosyltransferase involved in cell wall biosynthesis
MEGVRHLGAYLSRSGHDVSVLSLDDPRERYLEGLPLTVIALGPSRGKYAYNSKLVPWLNANACHYDAVIVNGLWNYHAFGSWRGLKSSSVPYYVFTHGMLDPWFRRTYPWKHLKKWLYWPWADYRLLRDARAVLFTSEEERLQARKSFWLYRANERVVKYGTNPPPLDESRLREAFLNAHPSLRNQRLLLYLSRIHEKKGCDLLINAFQIVAQQDPGLHLIMAGPDATQWVPELKTLAKDLGIAERITWPGMLQGDMKWGAFFASEAFVLPSHQENFGIAVAEALGCGKPVLISDKINIWREIVEAGAGIVNPDDLAGTVGSLRSWVALSADERRCMGENARELFRGHFTTEIMAADFLKVLEQKDTGGTFARTV